MKLKRYLSFLLTICMVLCSFTTSVYAINGCDGVLDAGEIELESYIEWNTFKSSVDGLSEEAIEELRSAEDRGIMPEMYPVGTNKVVIKTDIGFYPFIVNSDGSYSSLGSILRYAHIGSTGDNYVGTGTVSSGADDYGCCKLTGVTDYGYYGDDFYVLFTNYTKAWELSTSDIHYKVKKQDVHNSTDSERGGVLYKISGSDSDAFKVAFHTYSNCAGWGGTASLYWGDTSLFSVAVVEDDDTGYDERYYIMEYDFSKGLLNQTPDTSTVVNTCKPENATVSSVSGRFSTNSSNAIEVERDSAYPYAKVKHFLKYYDDENKFDYTYLQYDENDNGTRNVKPLGGFVNLGNYLHGTSRTSSSSQVNNALDIVKDLPTTALSLDQLHKLSRKLAVQCNENGIPFYITTHWNRKGCINTAYTTRLSRKHTDGKTYEDGRLRLYKPVKPQLGTDGKYILGQTTTFNVSGGMHKNATRLTFSNISLGSDAKIEIYGIGVDGSSNLLQTITNAKNSSGAYTTPTYPYGEVQIKFTGGTSTSGRGEGFVLSKAEYGKFGVSEDDYTYESVGKVVVPHVGYSGLKEAKYPSKGSTNHSKKLSFSYSSIGSKTKTLLASNIYVEGNKSYTYSNPNGTTNYYTPYYYGSYVILKNVETGTEYNLTTSSGSFTTTFNGPSGYYDAYGYIGGTHTTRCNYSITLGGTTYETKSSSANRSVTLSGIKAVDLSGLTVETYTVDPSVFSNLGHIILKSNIVMNIGDTAEIKVVSTNANMSTTSSTWKPRICETGTTTDRSYSSTYSKVTGTNTISKFVINQSYENTAMDIVMYNTSSDASYYPSAGDTITVNIYRRTLLDTKELTQDNIVKTTTQQAIVLGDVAYNNVPFMYYDIYIVRGGCTASQAYRMYINGTRYDVYNYDNSSIRMLAYSTSSLSYWCNSANYYDYIDSDTLIRIKAYDTAYRRLQSAYASKVGTADVSAPKISGYTDQTTEVSFTFPAVDAVWKLVHNGKVLGTVSTTASAEKELAIEIKKSVADSGIDIYSSVESNVVSIPYEVTSYYYDTAGTTYMRYANDAYKSLTYTVKSFDSSYMRIKISKSNVPSGMTLTVGGYSVTSAPYTGAWKNVRSLNIVVGIPASGDYGAYPSAKMDDVIEYELQTKSISDATSKTSYTNANIGEFSHTVTTGTNNSGSTTYTATLVYEPTITLSNVGNSYVKIVSTLTAPSADTDTKVTGTVSGYRDVTSFNLVGSSFSGTGYMPVTSSSLTFTLTPTKYQSSSTSSVIKAPSGYLIKDYYVVTASNIPDSAIKSYTPGYQTVATGTTKFGSDTLAELNSREDVNKIQIHNNMPTSKDNTSSYKETSGYWGSSKTFGSTYATKADGSEVQLTGNRINGDLNNNNFNCTIYADRGQYTALRFEKYLKIYEADTTISDVLKEEPTITFDIVVDSDMIVDYSSQTTKEGWYYYLPIIHIAGVEILNEPTNKALSSDATVSNLYNSTNPAKGSDGTAGGSFKLTMWTGDTRFADGRYGVAKLGQDIYYSSQWYSTVQRVDVYRDYPDGTTKNLAMVPVSATDSFFETTGGISGINEEPPSVYHVGNDLMYIPGNAVDSRTDGNAGISMAWLRTGHWHLKGNPDEIEGITIGGVENEIKGMDDDDLADTQIIVPELDMNAESWSMGHTIKDGRVTEKKLSEDVQDKINELNLGTITFVRNNGAQEKVIPVRNAYDTKHGYIDDCELTYGSYSLEMYVMDKDQVTVYADNTLLGNKNNDGSYSSKLAKGNYVFKGTTIQGNKEINVVIQVNVIDVPDKDTNTTLTFN